ncbi:MAG: hypothetical protein ACR2FO_07020 [Actinomycetota bacterium]
MDGSRIRSEQAGQTGIALIVIIAWALTAVFMLTRTLVSAQQIDDRVAAIDEATGSIKADTGLVELLTETNATAKGILAAAAPITGQLGEVDASAKSINTTVPSILASAQSINSTVKVINPNVSSILGVVRDIAGGASTLGGVRAINQRLDVALPIIRGIKGDTGSIKTDVRSGPGGIHGNLCQLDAIGRDDHC